jgi:hypothetical protein
VKKVHIRYDRSFDRSNEQNKQTKQTGTDDRFRIAHTPKKKKEEKELFTYLHTNQYGSNQRGKTWTKVYRTLLSKIFRTKKMFFFLGSLHLFRDDKKSKSALLFFFFGFVVGIEV